MPVTVKNISLWWKQVENKTGVLTQTLEPLAKAGADLRVVYAYPGNEGKALIKLYPVSGKKVIAAAAEIGLTASSIPTLLIEGDNMPDLGHSIAHAIADAGIDLDFLVAQVIGKKYAAIIGFGSDADAKKAATLIKKMVATKK